MIVDLTLAEWDQLEDSDRQRAAKRLASELPNGFQLVERRRFTLGSASHDMARFSFGGADFVFIPGGEAILGHDPNQVVELTRQQLIRITLDFRAGQCRHRRS